MQSQQSHLGQAGQSVAQTGHVLEIAGHIELAGQQVNGLIQYLTGRSGESAPLWHRPGRHALPGGAGRQISNEDISNDDAQTQMEFIP